MSLIKQGFLEYVHYGEGAHKVITEKGGHHHGEPEQGQQESQVTQAR